jgi:hypothetical protein
VSEKPVIAVAAIGDTPMSPVMSEEMVEMPALARSTKSPALPSSRAAIFPSARGANSASVEIREAIIVWSVGGGLPLTRVNAPVCERAVRVGGGGLTRDSRPLRYRLIGLTRSM